MFRDVRRDKVWNEIRQRDLKAFFKILTPAVLTQAARQAGVAVGCSALNVINLAWLGIACGVQSTANFAFVLKTTLQLLEDQKDFDSSPLGKEKKKGQQAEQKQGKKGKRGKKSKHDPYRNDATEVTEEAFAQARQRMPMGFWVALVTVLAKKFQQSHPQYLNFRDFRLLAMDGTSVALRNMPELRDHYGTPKNSKRKQAVPHLRTVMVTLPGVRVPIAFEASPYSESELALASKLTKHLQPNDLLLMDRGFTSYGLFWQIQNRGAYFGMRLRKDIKYKRVKHLGPKDWLVKWTPKDSRRKWRDLPDSIDLRVIHYQIRGFRASAITTNVLDPKRLPREDWVRLAKDCDDNGKLTPGLYHRRWEIETSFCELKVVLKLESLRSRTPKSVEFELAGRIVYYLLIRWLIVLAAEKHGLDPLRISFTDAVREIEQMRATLLTADLARVRSVLLPRLLDRIASHIVPARPGRHYARPKDTQPINRGHGRKQPASKLSARVNTKRRKAQRKARAKA